MSGATCVFRLAVLEPPERRRRNAQHGSRPHGTIVLILTPRALPTAMQVEAARAVGSAAWRAWPVYAAVAASSRMQLSGARWRLVRSAAGASVNAAGGAAVLMQQQWWLASRELRVRVERTRRVPILVPTSPIPLAIQSNGTRSRSQWDSNPYRIRSTPAPAEPPTPEDRRGCEFHDASGSNWDG